MPDYVAYFRRGVHAVQPGADRSHGSRLPGGRLRLRRRADVQRQELPHARARRPAVSLARSTSASTRVSRRTSWSGSARRSSRGTSTCAPTSATTRSGSSSRGAAAAGPTRPGRPRSASASRQIGFSATPNLYDTGAHGVIVRTRSFYPDALDPKVKNFSRMNFNLAELEASDVDPEGWPILTRQPRQPHRGRRLQPLPRHATA